MDDGKGHLVTAPSTSPENKFRHGGQPGTISAGATMDLALMRDLFSSTADAAEALGIDAPFRKQLLDARAKLRRTRSAARASCSNGARSSRRSSRITATSRTCTGLHPGRHITAATPALFAAVRRSHELRGDEATGWSMGWKIN